MFDASNFSRRAEILARRKLVEGMMMAMLAVVFSVLTTVATSVVAMVERMIELFGRLYDIFSGTIFCDDEGF